VRTAFSTNIISLVVNEALENFINGLTDYGLTTLQLAMFVAARISREIITKAVATIFIIPGIGLCMMTCDTQSITPVSGAICFQF